MTNIARINCGRERGGGKEGLSETVGKDGARLKELRRLLLREIEISGEEELRISNDLCGIKGKDGVRLKGRRVRQPNRTVVSGEEELRISNDLCGIKGKDGARLKGRRVRQLNRTVVSGKDEFRSSQDLSEESRPIEDSSGNGCSSRAGASSSSLAGSIERSSKEASRK